MKWLEPIKAIGMKLLGNGYVKEPAFKDGISELRHAMERGHDELRQTQEANYTHVLQELRAHDQRNEQRAKENRELMDRQFGAQFGKIDAILTQIILNQKGK